MLLGLQGELICRLKMKFGWVEFRKVSMEALASQLQGNFGSVLFSTAVLSQAHHPFGFLHQRGGECGVTTVSVCDVRLSVFGTQPNVQHKSPTSVQLGASEQVSTYSSMQPGASTTKPSGYGALPGCRFSVVPAGEIFVMTRFLNDH